MSFVHGDVLRVGLGDATVGYTSLNCFSRQLRHSILAAAHRARVRCFVSLGRPFETHVMTAYGASLAWSAPVPATYQSSATAFFYVLGDGRPNDKCDVPR